MSRKLLILLSFILLAAPFARALEVISPQPGSILGDGKVIVIGLAGGAEKGKASFGGQSTSFKITAGAFSVVLNLPKGSQEVVFTVGNDTAKVKWDVQPGAKGKVFSYHPSVENDKCSTCHDGNAKLTKSDTVSNVCERCHKQVDKSKVLHGPVAMGLCAACHDSHGSTEDSFLRIPYKALCEDCHNQPVGEKHHKIAGDSACIKCHDPHGSSKPFMIK